MEFITTYLIIKLAAAILGGRHCRFVTAPVAAPLLSLCLLWQQLINIACRRRWVPEIYRHVIVNVEYVPCRQYSIENI